jgi:hypothetical protein
MKKKKCVKKAREKSKTENALRKIVKQRYLLYTMYGTLKKIKAAIAM